MTPQWVCAKGSMVVLEKGGFLMSEVPVFALFW